MWSITIQAPWHLFVGDVITSPTGHNLAATADDVLSRSIIKSMGPTETLYL